VVRKERCFRPLDVLGRELDERLVEFAVTVLEELIGRKIEVLEHFRFQEHGGEDGAYSTAFASLCLAIPDARLSIFNRRPPTLPESDSREENG